MRKALHVLGCSLFSLAPLLCVWSCAAAADVKVDARQAGSRVAIHMESDVKASRATVWAVLTDYEGAPGWVPGMKQSRVLSRDGTQLTVSQRGEADFLVFSMPVEAVLKVTELPPDRISVKSLQGSFRFMEGGYLLRTMPAGADKADVTRVEWTGQLEPDFDLPAFMTVSLVSRNVQMQFEGLIWEMERRERVLDGLSAPPKPGVKITPRSGEL